MSEEPAGDANRLRTQVAELKAENRRLRAIAEPMCVCAHVDIGVGIQKVDEDRSCPACWPDGRIEHEHNRFLLERIEQIRELVDGTAPSTTMVALSAPGWLAQVRACLPEPIAADRQAAAAAAAVPVPPADTEPTVAEIREVIEQFRALADRLESQHCTGVSARWCPVHGTCTCPTYADDPEHADPASASDDYDVDSMDDDSCPLHSTSSTHAAEHDTDRTTP